MTILPIGQSESETLEFKSAAALDHAETIARAAVALLNGPKHGSIWVGILESNEIAVAAENLGDKASRRRRELEDAFADLIEPPTTSVELSVETVQEGATTVLRVDCSGHRRPYALRTPKGGRMYLIRRGATTRTMTREEIRDAFAKSPEPRATHLAPQPLIKELIARRHEGQGDTEPRIWLAACPALPLTLDLQDPEIQRLLTIPEESGNRRGACWSVVTDKLELRLGDRRIQFGEDPNRVLALSSTGLLSFRAPLRILTEPNHPTRLYSHAVLEYPASLVRVASRCYADHASLSDDDFVWLDLAICRAAGWTLLPDAGQPFDFDPVPPQTLEGGTLAHQPLQIPWQQLRDEPDRVSRRLVNDVYQAFGLDRARIPDVYDPQSGRLAL